MGGADGESKVCRTWAVSGVPLTSTGSTVFAKGCRLNCDKLKSVYIYLNATQQSKTVVLNLRSSFGVG